MKKRLIACLLALCMVLGMVPFGLVTTADAATVLASGTCGGEGDGTNLTWELTEDGVLTISGEGKMAGFSPNMAESGVAPWSNAFFHTVIIEAGVTNITGYAFEDCVDFTQITIPKSITSIGPYAFLDCDSLVQISIPSSVSVIWDEAFVNCDKLSAINVDENNPNFSSDGFGVLFNKDKTTLKQAPMAISGSYTIPDTVNGISGAAFSGCGNLTQVIIPNSVSYIGHYAFRYCNALTEVTIPGSVTTIGDCAFWLCDTLGAIVVDENNPNYSSDSFGVLFNKDKTALIQAPGAISSAYTIPASVTTIGDRAFAYCESLASVTIPDSVIAIGGSAFGGCASLASVTIPDSVTTIGDWAFFHCDSLAEIYFKGDAPEFGGNTVFSGVTATAYYPAGNNTWTEEVMQDYGGNITWVAVTSAELDCVCENGVFEANLTYDAEEVSNATVIIALYDRSGKLMRTEMAADKTPDGKLTLSVDLSTDELPEIGRVSAFAVDGVTKSPLCERWTKTLRNAVLDIDTLGTYTEAATVLTEIGIIDPYIDDSFSPDTVITRAEFAQMLYRIIHNDPTDKYAGIYADYNKFSDVKASDWFAGYVHYCANGEYLLGDSNGNFIPYGNVTGYQLLAVMLRALGYDMEGEFTGSGWNIRVARKAKELGITANIDESTLSAPVTRDLAAELIFRSIAQASTVNWKQDEGYTLRYTTLGFETFGLRGTVEEIVGGSAGYTADDFAAMTTPEPGYDETGKPVTCWYLGNGDRITVYTDSDEPDEPETPDVPDVPTTGYMVVTSTAYGGGSASTGYWNTYKGYDMTGTAVTVSGGMDCYFYGSKAEAQDYVTAEIGIYFYQYDADSGLYMLTEDENAALYAGETQIMSKDPCLSMHSAILTSDTVFVIPAYTKSGLITGYTVAKGFKNIKDLTGDLQIAVLDLDESGSSGGDGFADLVLVLNAKQTADKKYTYEGGSCFWLMDTQPVTVTEEYLVYSVIQDGVVTRIKTDPGLTFATIGLYEIVAEINDYPAECRSISSARIAGMTEDILACDEVAWQYAACQDGWMVLADDAVVVDVTTGKTVDAADLVVDWNADTPANGLGWTWCCGVPVSYNSYGEVTLLYVRGGTDEELSGYVMVRGAAYGGYATDNGYYLTINGYDVNGKAVTLPGGFDTFVYGTKTDAQDVTAEIGIYSYWYDVENGLYMLSAAPVADFLPGSDPINSGDPALGDSECVADDETVYIIANYSAKTGLITGYTVATGYKNIKNLKDAEIEDTLGTGYCDYGISVLDADDDGYAELVIVFGAKQVSP